ncbi:MAG TPA: FRG domain-containing protein [Longimicrobiaceae bacterium]|nr:FRG domain-containing protein [Longimicrobiaceae bacterium]
MWPTLTLRDWDHFLRIASHLSYQPPHEVAYLARGQANASWTLSTSLQRSGGDECDIRGAMQIERYLLESFQEEVHLHLRAASLPTSGSLLEWWALMQHHGAPTRLLDWTKSPYVAAYFAVEQQWDQDGAIWLFHVATVTHWATQQHGDLDYVSNAVLTNPEAGPRLFYWAPQKRTERMIAQQGAFTACLSPSNDHGSLIEAACGPEHGTGSDEVYRKLIIPAELKPRFLRQLRQMNVTASALFPGVDGLGRSMAELARLSVQYLPRNS